MFRTRFRKILRDIRSRKVRTALVSVSIFIGVFGTVTLFSMGDLLVRQLRQDLDQNKLAMVRVYLALPPAAQVDNAQLLATLRSQPNITTVEGLCVLPPWLQALSAAPLWLVACLCILQCAHEPLYLQDPVCPPRLDQ